MMAAAACAAERGQRAPAAPALAAAPTTANFPGHDRLPFHNSKNGVRRQGFRRNRPSPGAEKPARRRPSTLCERLVLPLMARAVGWREARHPEVVALLIVEPVERLWAARQSLPPNVSTRGCYSTRPITIESQNSPLAPVSPRTPPSAPTCGRDQAAAGLLPPCAAGLARRLA